MTNEEWLSKSIQEDLERMLRDEPSGLRYDAEGFERVRGSILKTISEALEVPALMMTVTLTVSEKDTRRFYGRINALHKGFRRRNRRFRATLSRLVRKR